MINSPFVKMENSRRQPHQQLLLQQNVEKEQSQHKHQQWSSSSTGRGVTSRMLPALSLFLILACMTPGAFSEYENTWNFYYEQPCCGSTPSHETPSNSINGQVPHRFHRGRYPSLDPIQYSSVSVPGTKQSRGMVAKRTNEVGLEVFGQIG